MENLLEHLHGTTVDRSELEQLLVNHFRSARQVQENEVVYPSEEPGYSMKLIYDKKDLVEIVAGPKLTRDDVETIRRRIEEELLVDAGVGVCTRVLFSHVPVDGCFRYRDSYQILPVPSDAPKPPVLIAEHPFLLEFKFPSSPNVMIRQLRQAVRQREIELLLNGLSEGSIRALGARVRYHWVLISDLDQQDFETDYRQEMYSCPGILPESDRFSTIEDVSRMREVDSQEYYTRLGVDPSHTLQLPSNFRGLLDRFYGLSPQDQDRFIRSCYWFQHADIVDSYSRSASFGALISAIGVCTSLPTTPHLVVGRSACRVGVGPSLNRSWAQRSRPVVQAGRRAFPGDESVVD